ncbi:sigma-70 family RNA polymerase sigma factor [Achromobacter seleniivolatilans]|uniref:Sigma-70 family RNA polymerase sigma factor n=1 Tax=Achromobacter seleniivolatilans TaxID=3047478 RepID=A0ABY9M628_9BURK|nr:sigma-70 family RNA polymerase sigma factor [Achromobacter sp. R39]WMD22476.1 sigma-70 family RNA polymerase sigma factor [Achromobacter sp. R39]
MPVPNPSLCVETLYNDHHGWLRGWLRRRLGDAHQAADLAHDTFVRLLSRDEHVAIQEPRAYLTTIAQRVVANHWRREKLEQAYLEAIAQDPQALALSPEDRAILLETLVEIAGLLDGLPVLVKRAFLLTQLDGLNHAQVAEELGISVTTVKRHIARAARQCYFPDALPVKA